MPLSIDPKITLIVGVPVRSGVGNVVMNLLLNLRLANPLASPLPLLTRLRPQSCRHIAPDLLGANAIGLIFLHLGLSPPVGTSIPSRNVPLTSIGSL